MINRRFFLASSTAAFAAGVAPASVATNKPAGAYPLPPINPAGDPLNTPGIRVSGIRMLPVYGGKYKVWTKQIGSGELKVLLLHGGPGFSHDYLEAFESFLPQAGIQFFYYDQLGSNLSDQPDDPVLWTLPRFVEEVEEVRRGLGLENFVLFGHSWGGILCTEYALKYQQHLRGLVISNMVASIERYVRRTNQLRKTLLTDQQEAALSKMESAGDYDNPAYEKLMLEVLYPQMVCRTKPWPEPLTRALRVANQKIYNQMQGKSEFEVTGNLRAWERFDRLHEIKIPTLVIAAEHDEMDPVDLREMAHLLPEGSFAICPNGSHLCMWDDQATYFRQLIAFLKML